MAAKEFNHYVIGLSGFGNVGIVEKAVEESFPDMQLGIDPELHELRVCVHSGTHLESSGPGDDQRGWEFSEHLWRMNRGDKRVLGIGGAKIGQM
jgi:hypothetical protein